MQLISQIQSPLAVHINHDTTLLKKDHIEASHWFFVSNNTLLHVETYLCNISLSDFGRGRMDYIMNPLQKRKWNENLHFGQLPFL